MSLYLADSTDLTAVANAIRTKGGTSDQLEFPDEFVSAIAAIPAGGTGEFKLLASGTYTQVSDGALSIPVEYTGTPIMVYVYVPELLESTSQLFQAIFYAGEIPSLLVGSVWQNGFGLKRIQTAGGAKQLLNPSNATSDISFSSSAISIASTPAYPNRANDYNWYIWGYES